MLHSNLFWWLNEPLLNTEKFPRGNFLAEQKVSPGKLLTSRKLEMDKIVRTNFFEERGSAISKKCSELHYLILSLSL
jgi:hypothetical protein